MKPAKDSPRPGTAQPVRVVSIAGAAAGFLGGLACSASMVLAAVGVIGAAAAAGSSSMSGMAGAGQAGLRSRGGGISRFLLHYGPTILVVSIGLVTLALALRRRPPAVGAAAVGALMYWGMYVQANLTVMYVTIAVGLVAWLGLVLPVNRFAMGPQSPDVDLHVDLRNRRPGSEYPWKGSLVRRDPSGLMET